MLKKKLNIRKECNKLLNEVVNLHQEVFPELRYIQSLWALGIIDKDNEIIDRFYEEPYDTIVRIFPNIKILLQMVKDMENSTIMMRIKVSNINFYLKELNIE